MSKLLLSLSVSLLGVALVNVVAPAPSAALSGSEFQAGRIIDDGVFFNPNTIDSNTIQVFLNSKTPTCDTNGTQPHHSGGTRAAYATSRGYPPPYTCLRNYTQDTPAKAGETGLCNPYTGGPKSAAKIIYDVGQACGINPKALIVLLEKEQSLVTDDWPWSIQYRSATGYGCPDTAPCDAEYYGFFNQVYNAARQFKKYARDSTSFRYRAGRENYIQYNPNAACGGTNVFIQNQATAGLYNYTPYQPNPSALANLHGSGDGCGAYGNRNFWVLFNEWFGSANANCVFPQTKPNGIYRLYNKGTGNHLLTTNPSEVCAATSIGYLYDGQMLKEEPGQGKPVYRLERGGRYLFTDSAVERDSAVNQNGFRLEGVGFNGVDPALNPQSSRPVYRLASQSGTYTYTISSFERDKLASYGYRYEGVGFHLYENPGIAVSSVFRLSHPNGIYIYTLSETEKNNAMSVYGYRYEGVGFKGITELNPITVPVYRLASNRGYVMTTSLLERLQAIQLGYRDEGIAMYTYGTSNDAGLNKTYRLANSSGVYLYTISEEEKNVASQRYGYRIEGVGFLTP